MLKKLSKILFILSLAGASLCAFSGCGYSLGTGGKLPFSTIEIAPIINEADLPQAQAMLARDIADTLNRDPQLSTVIENGTVELCVVITEYKRSISATSARDSVLASTQKLTLTLKCSLLDTRTGKFYFRDRSVSVDTEVYTGTSPGLGEPQSFPVLSREAARKIRDMIVSVW